jgi:hypothetical protein
MWYRIRRLNTLVVVFTALIFSTHFTAAQEADILNEIWEHELGPSLVEKPDILNLFVGDINNDFKAEVSVVTSGRASTGYTKEKNRVYVYRGNGSTYWEYGVGTTIMDVVLFDINNDQNIEHIVSGGERRENIQRGSLRIMGWNGESLRSFDLASSMDAITVGDLDNDRYHEIAIGSERIFLYHSYGEKIWIYPAKGEGVLNNTVGDIVFGNMDKDDYKDIVAGADVLYFLNRNGNLMAEYDLEPDVHYLKKGVKYVDVLDLSAGKYPEIIAVTLSNEVHALRIDELISTGKGEEQVNKITLDESWVKFFDCEINKIQAVNVDADEYLELLVGCSDHVLRALDNNGVLLWDYIVDGEVKDTAIADMDEDGVGDIVVGTSSGTVYLLDLKGNFKWKYVTPDGIIKIGVGDLDGDKLNDIVTVTDNSKIRAYVVNQTFTMRRRADMYYSLGRDNYISSNFDIAEDYLLKARELYSILGYLRGVEDAQTLLSRIGEKRIDNRRVEADMFYDKAQESFINGEYKNAQNFVQRAKTIYMEFGDTENVLKCELLELRIESILKGNVPTETIPKLNKTEKEETQRRWQPPMDYRIISILLFLVIAVLIIGFRKKGGVELIGQEGQDSGIPQDFWTEHYSDKNSEQED